MYIKQTSKEWVLFSWIIPFHTVHRGDRDLQNGRILLKVAKCTWRFLLLVQQVPPQAILHCAFAMCAILYTHSPVIIFPTLFIIDILCFHSGRAVKLDWTGKLHSLKKAEHKKAGDVVTVLTSEVCCLLLVSHPALQMIDCNSLWMSTQSRVLLEWVSPRASLRQQEGHRKDAFTT